MLFYYMRTGRQEEEEAHREEGATSKAKAKAKAKHRTGETNKNGNEIMQLVA